MLASEDLALSRSFRLNCQAALWSDLYKKASTKNSGVGCEIVLSTQSALNVSILDEIATVSKGGLTL